MLPLIMYFSTALVWPALAAPWRDNRAGVAAQAAYGSAAAGPGNDSAATVWRADDGLFYVNATINGAPVRLIVDTGASMTVLSPADARRAGVDGAPGSVVEIAETAGGERAMARVKLARMQVGRTAAQGVTAVVASQPLPFSLLGQNWLSRLGSVTIEGDRMTFR